MGSEPGPKPESVFDLDLSLFNRKFEHGCLHFECRSCAERTDDPVLKKVREIFGDQDLNRVRGNLRRSMTKYR